MLGRPAQLASAVSIRSLRPRRKASTASAGVGFDGLWLNMGGSFFVGGARGPWPSVKASRRSFARKLRGEGIALKATEGVGGAGAALFGNKGYIITFVFLPAFGCVLVTLWRTLLCNRLHLIEDQLLNV